MVNMVSNKSNNPNVICNIFISIGIEKKLKTSCIY